MKHLMRPSSLRLVVISLMVGCGQAAVDGAGCGLCRCRLGPVSSLIWRNVAKQDTNDNYRSILSAD